MVQSYQAVLLAWASKPLGQWGECGLPETAWQTGANRDQRLEREGEMLKNALQPRLTLYLHGEAIYWMDLDYGSGRGTITDDSKRAGLKVQVPDMCPAGAS